MKKCAKREKSPISVESTIDKVVLVGTYRKENAEWIKVRKLYNLPLPSCGKVAFHESISQIVLLADGFQTMAFAAKFREVVENVLGPKKKREVA